MSQDKQLRKPTDAQRTAVLAFDHLFRAVHTIDCWMQKDGDAHKTLLQEFADEADDEYKTLYIAIINLVHTMHDSTD